MPYGPRSGSSVKHSGCASEMHSIDTIRPADVEQKAEAPRVKARQRLAILTTLADVLAGAALSTRLANATRARRSPLG